MSHNERDGVSNHQPHHCLLNGLFRYRSKKTSTRHWPLWGIHRWPVNSPHKGPVTRKMFPFDDVIMLGITSVKLCPQYSLMQLSCVAASDWWRGIWQRDPFYLSFLLSKSTTNMIWFHILWKVFGEIILTPQLCCHDIYKYPWQYDDQDFNHNRFFHLRVKIL